MEKLYLNAKLIVLLRCSYTMVAMVLGGHNVDDDDSTYKIRYKLYKCHNWIGDTYHEMALI